MFKIVHLPTFGDATLDKFFCYDHFQNFLDVKSAPPLGSACRLHNLIIIYKSENNLKNSVIKQKVFDLRQSNVAAFCSRISNVDWSILSRFECINDCVEYFYKEFFKAMTCIPVTYVRVSPATKPWITPLLLELINKRWKAFRSNDLELYKHYKNKVRIEIDKSKAIWSKKLRSSPKGVWFINTNKIRGKNETSLLIQGVSLFQDVHRSCC